MEWKQDGNTIGDDSLFDALQKMVNDKELLVTRTLTLSMKNLREDEFDDLSIVH